MLSQFLAATSILFIGDSHSVAPHAPFGATLNQLLRTIPQSQVTTHARCGSTLKWWYTGQFTHCGAFDQDANGNQLIENIAPTPQVLPMLQSTKPKLIIIEMGGNYLRSKNAIAEMKADVAPFLVQVNHLKKENNVKCVWVGPPARRDPVLTAKMPAFIQALKKTVSPTCTFFDSSKVTHYPAKGGDGVHYSFKPGSKNYQIGVNWAKAVFETLSVF